MNRFSMALALVAALFLAGTASAVEVTWDGGAGFWNDANWTSGEVSGQTAADVMGINAGPTENHGSDGGHEVSIGGGATVTYDQNGVDGGSDFTFRQNNGYASLTISGGAKLTMDEETCCEDGQWARWDANDLILDNGTFERTLTTGMGSLSGGMLAVASWNADDDQTINITLKNGGQINHDGVFLMGYEDEMGANVTANLVIYDGHLDLTGGDNYPMGDLLWENDLVITSFGEFALNEAGFTANFDASINFRGSGSITVDEGGIANPHKNDGNVWENITTKITYEDLWNRGLLKAHGESGLDTDSSFSSFFTTTGASGSADYKLEAKAQTVVTWDGGDGNWNSASWNGGGTADAIMGTQRGNEGGFDVRIDGNVTVTYDQNNVEGGQDFRFNTNNGVSSLTISGGATLTMDEETCCEDGQWTRWDATHLNIDGGTFSRTLTTGSGSLSGGMMAIGSWQAEDGQEININVTGGGRIEHDGVFLMGYEDEMGAGVRATLTIDNGHMDLTGGDNYPMGDLLWENDLVITSFGELALNEAGVVADFSAVINFEGSGSITVDEGGIANPHKNDGNVWENITTLITYEDLWDRGLLQANGLSGLDGEVFFDYFEVTGSSGLADYILTSLISPPIPGDFNGDGKVNGEDFIEWQIGFGTIYDGNDFLDWQGNFPFPGAGNGSGAVPEPASALLALIAALGIAFVSRRR